MTQPGEGGFSLRRFAAAIRYLPLDAHLTVCRRVYGIEYVNRWLLSSPSHKATHHVLRRFGANLALSASAATHLIIDNATTGDYSRLRLGEHAYLGKGCLLDLVEAITIEDEAAVSGACVLRLWVRSPTRAGSEMVLRRHSAPQG